MRNEIKRVETPDWGVPAGEVLAEALAERGWSQAELARRTNRPIKTVNEIIRGRSTITPETALQLELVLGVPASLWLNLERNFSEWQARRQEQERFRAEMPWAERFPLRDLAKHRLIPATGTKLDRVQELLRFFGVTSPIAWERQWESAAVSYRRAAAYEPKRESVFAWLRWGEIEAAKIDCAQFDAERLREVIPQVRPLTRLDFFAFQPQLQELLASGGVAVVFLPELADLHLNGAARWLGPEKALIQLSFRHKREDVFWFSVFHELDHLLRGGRRKTFIDLGGAADPTEEDERAADLFAGETLIPEVLYRKFVEARDFSTEAVKRFAKEIDVSPGIVVGRLQREEQIGRGGALNRLITPIHWPDEPRRGSQA